MAEVTYPPAGAGCRALSTSRPCPGYCTARVGATVKHSRNQSAMVPLLGRALFLLLEAAVAGAKCGMLYHVPSIQARNQVTHKVILRLYCKQFSRQQKSVKFDSKLLFLLLLCDAVLR